MLRDYTHDFLNFPCGLTSSHVSCACGVSLAIVFCKITSELITVYVMSYSIYTFNVHVKNL